MKRMTIIKEDNLVGIDGEFYVVDCSSLPENFHALQWYANEANGDNDMGEVEWRGRPKPPNTEIYNLDEYQSYIDAWNLEKAKALPPTE